MALRSSATRYGDVAIAIHWCTAALVVALFATGLLAAGQVDPTAKLALVRAHIPLGVGALLLTLLRMLWWLVADRRPVPPSGLPGWQTLAARAVHIGLYLVVLESAASGIATVVLSGALPAILAGGALPDFNTVLPRVVHGIGSKVMLGLLTAHVGAALWHQFIRRDHLLARMGVGGIRR